MFNHREIEFYANKRWKEQNVELSDLKNVFSEWKDEKQKDSAIELLKWLDNKGEVLFDEDLIMDYGTDCLRVYLMFEKEPKENDPYYDSWEECNLEGAYKFLGKYRRMIETALEANRKGLYDNQDVEELLNLVDEIKVQVMEDISKGNTMPNRHNAISAIMEGFKKIQNELNIGQYIVQFHSHDIEQAVPVSDKQNHKEEIIQQGENPKINKLCKELIILASPFAPYISEELIQYVDKDLSILNSKYVSNKNKIEKKKIIPVQINGKTKKILEFDEGTSEEQILEQVNKAMTGYLEGATYNTVYIKEKIINYVIQM